MNNKIEAIKQVVMESAACARDVSAKDAKLEIRETLEKVELDILTKAYDNIQSELWQMRNENAAKLSKLKENSRAKIFERKDAMTTEVFVVVLKNITEYTLTDEYFQKLKNKILSTLEFIDDENAVLRLTKRDAEKLSSVNAKIEIEDDSIIGGFFVFSEKKQILIDNTLKSRLEEIRNRGLWSE